VIQQGGEQRVLTVSAIALNLQLADEAVRVIDAHR